MSTRFCKPFNDCGVEYLLIGGMNFLLRHEPVLTYDIDFWIRDTKLDAAWGPAENSWLPVADQPGWLGRQSVFCLTSPSGAIDIFRAVTGLASWQTCRDRAVVGHTSGGVAYPGALRRRYDHLPVGLAGGPATDLEDRKPPQCSIKHARPGPPPMTNTHDETVANELADLAAGEHARRERAWSPAERWKALQETIRWAEAQPTARRNTPQACLERERKLLQALGD